VSLCSSCSAPVQPIVAIDVDGTIAEYHRHLHDHCTQYFDLRHLSSWNDPWDGSGNFEDYIGITQQQYQEAKLSFRQGGLKRTMRVMPHTFHLMKKIRQEGAEIWITTTRPWNRFDSVDPDTREWLRRNDIPWDHLLYDDHKYRRLHELVDPERVVAIVDDLPEMYEEAVQMFGYSVPALIVRPHNAAYRRTHQGYYCPDLYAFANHAIGRILKWHSIHQSQKNIEAIAGG